MIPEKSQLAKNLYLFYSRNFFWNFTQLEVKQASGTFFLFMTSSLRFIMKYFQGRHLLNFLLEPSTTDKVLNKMNSCIQEFVSEKVLDPQTIPISKTLAVRISFTEIHVGLH